VSLITLIEDARMATLGPRRGPWMSAVDEHRPILDLFKNAVPVTGTLCPPGGSSPAVGRDLTRACLAASRMAG
jgi:hypothetical protein